MGQEYFEFEKDPKRRVGWLTFNRPEKLNNMTFEDAAFLGPLLRKIERDDDVKVLIVKGAGDCFGSGGDVMMLGPETVGFSRDPKDPKPSLRTRIPGERRMMVEGGEQGLFIPFANFCKPCIAQVHGYCYGWHFMFCSYIDIVVSSEEALFTHPAFRYICESWPAPRWMEEMGYKRVAEMMFTGRAFTAEEMEKCGFVNKVVPNDKLEETVLEIASIIAIKPLELLMGDKYYLEILRDMNISSSASRIAGYAHLMSTYMKMEEGDFSILKETTRRGPSDAIDERERRYPPKYRLSYKGRAAKE